MAATLKIYLNAINMQTNLDQTKFYWVYYTVTVDTTGDTSAENATLTLTHGGSVESGTYGTISGLRIPANSSTAVMQVYQHTTGVTGTVTLQASLNLGSYGTVTASKSVVLGQSQPEATAQLSVPYNVTLGESFEIGVSGSSARTYDVRCYTSYFSDLSAARGTYFTVLSGVEAGAYDVTIPPSQLSDIMADETRVSVDFVVIAYSSTGSAVCINDDQMGNYLNMPSSAVPVISSVTPSDLNGHHSTYGVYVQRFSDIQVAVQSSGVYGSTITDIKNTLDSLSSNGTATSQHLGAPLESGQRTLVTVVTDSRGRTTTRRTTITVGAYTAPTIQELLAQRWGADGTEDDSSDTVRLSLTGALCVINGHGVTGTATFRGRENVAGTELSVIATKAVSGNFGTTTQEVGNQDVETSYVYEVTLTDAFGQSSVVTAQVGTSRPIMDWHVGGESMGLWTTAREAEYQDGTPARGLFVGSDIILSEGQSISGSGGTETGEMSYDRLLRASYNYATDSFLIDLLQHVVLENGKHLAAKSASGVITRLLGMNESGQVELNWTSGGLRGRVMKWLWSGTLSKGGSVTIAELPYYNVFGIVKSGDVGIGIKNGGSIVGVVSQITGNATNEHNMSLFRLAVSGTKLTYNTCVLMSPTSNAYLLDDNIDGLYGIL